MVVFNKGYYKWTDVNNKHVLCQYKNTDTKRAIYAEEELVKLVITPEDIMPIIVYDSVENASETKNIIKRKNMADIMKRCTNVTKDIIKKINLLVSNGKNIEQISDYIIKLISIRELTNEVYRYNGTVHLLISYTSDCPF